MTRLLLALAIAVTLSLVEFGWRVEIPPLPAPRVAPQLHAAPVDEPDDCPLIGNAGGTNIYRCLDWEMGKVCYVNSYGFLFCLEE